MHLHLPPLLEGLFSIAVFLGVVIIALKLLQEVNSKQSNKTIFVGTVEKRWDKWQSGTWIIVGIVIGIVLAQWLPLHYIISPGLTHLAGHLFWVGVALLAIIIGRRLIYTKTS